LGRPKAGPDGLPEDDGCRKKPGAERRQPRARSPNPRVLSRADGSGESPGRPGGRRDRLRSSHPSRRARRPRRAHGGHAQRPRPAFRRRGGADGRRPGPGDGHGHGQVRPYRPQDRRDARLHRHPGLLHAPRRGLPRGSRHDPGRPGRDRRPVLVRRDHRAVGRDLLRQALSRAPRRHHGAGRLDARPSGGHLPRPAPRSRSLPQRPGAHHLHHHAARPRRRPRPRAPGGARFFPRATSAASIPAASSGRSSSRPGTSCTRASACR
jgi:hypothetical protein